MKKRPKKSAPVAPEAIAAALAEADVAPDEMVAHRIGVGVNTLRKWRGRALVEPELGKLVVGARHKMVNGWRAEASLTYRAIAREIRRLVGVGQEVPFSLIAAAKTFGAANIEAGALLGEEEGELEDKKP